MSALHLVPVRARDARDFVAAWHRHHAPAIGQVFAVAADDDGVLRAVAVAGRPVARHFDDGATLEVTRTASDGALSANSPFMRGLLAGGQSPGIPAADHLHPGRRERRRPARRRLEGVRPPPPPARLAHPLPPEDLPRHRPHRPHPVGGAMTTASSRPALRVLSLGAGVQSTSLLLLAAEGRLPKLDAAIFADTGWEPRAVYEHLDRIEREVARPAGIPILRVSSGNIRDDALDPGTRFASMPLHILNADGGMGMSRRQCTVICTSLFSLIGVLVIEMKESEVDLRHELREGRARRMCPPLRDALSARARPVD